MAANAFEFVVSLSDQVSGPANKAADALDDVGNAANRASKDTGGFGAAAVAVGTLAAQALAKVAEVAFDAAKATAKFAYDSAVFKENTMIALETLVGSKQEADRLYKQAVEFAGKTPFETPQVIETYQKLLTAGFKPMELDIVMKGVGDLAALKGMSTEIMDRVTEAFGKIQAQGKLTGESMDSLASAGIPLKRVYEVLGTQLGITAAQAKKLQSEGKIDATTGIAATLQALQETVSGGELGGMMDKLSQSLGGLVSSLTSRPFELFNAVQTGPALDNVKGFVKSLSDALDPASDTGKPIVGMFEDIGTSFGEFVKTIQPFVLDFLAFLPELKGVFSETFGTVSGLFGKTAEDGDGAAKMFEALKTILLLTATALGVVAGAISLVVTAYQTLLVWAGEAGSAVGNFVFDVVGAFDQLGADISSGVALFTSIGSDLVGGFLTGIESSWQGVKDFFLGGVQGLVTDAKALLGIHSPSTVFAAIGANVGAGFEEGLDTGAPQAAIGAMVAAPTTTAAGGGGSTTFAPSITINVDGAGGAPGDIAEEIRRVTAEEVLTLFRQLSIELAS